MENDMLTVSQDSLVGLQAKVDFLSRPASYPESSGSVEARETHMSWVFLTDRHAYKLKKPVRTSFLDFSTLELRKKYCEAEVWLNRRLAPGIYLGVVPLGLDRSGNLHIGEGQAVDFLVRMIRLPATATLDHAIRANAVEERNIHNLASRLAGFYRDAMVIGCGADAYRRRFVIDIEADTQALLQPRYGLPATLINETSAALRNFIALHGDRLEQRARERRIVDGHGDLRPEHIYFLPDRIAVIDRLEFNAAFREVDPLNELAYLAMECDRCEATWIGPWLLETYRAESGDSFGAELVDFYKCSRALLRAKLAIWHLDGVPPREPEKWPRQAKSYLDLAHAYATGL